MGSPLFATKPIETLMNEAGESGEHCLKRALGPINLVTLGIWAIIGAGIFVITGQAAAQFAGPAIIISFVLAGVACAFAGLCYAEFASLIPIAGSAYTYSYATLGELIAWIIGWDLILEYAFGAATVAVGWSGHLRAFLRDVGWNLPAIPTSSFTLFGLPVQLKYDYVGFLVIMAITAILVIGIKESANFTTAIVILKVAVVCLFIALATRFLSSHDGKPNFWHPFIPTNKGGQKPRGQSNEQADHRNFQNHNRSREISRFLDADHQNRSDGHDDEETDVVVLQLHRQAKQCETGSRYGGQIPSDVAQERSQVAAPTDRHGRRAKCVFEDQVPPDNPRNQLAKRRIRIGIGASGNRDQRREFRVAQPCEGACDARKHERNDDRRPRKLRRCLPRDDKDSRADDGPNSQRDQVNRAESALQAVLSRFTRLVPQRFDRFRCKQGAAHATPPLGICRSPLSLPIRPTAL